MRHPRSLAVVLLAVLLPAFAAGAGAPKGKAPGKAGLPPLPPGVTALRDLAYVKSGHERQKLDLALKKAGVDASLYIVKGGGHGGFKDSPPASPHA